MVLFCCVLGCSSRGNRDKVSFFRIPANVRNSAPDTEELSVQRRHKWIKALNREIKEESLKNARVCSRHFISGKPAPLEDRDNPDWIPSRNMGCTKNSLRRNLRINQGTRKKTLTKAVKKSSASKSASSQAMAPERSGQGLIPSNTVVKQEVVGPPKQTSILEDFLEIKIKEELEYRENCGEGARNKIKREEDQDLTSLTWLQNNNLLKSKPLTLPETVKKVKHEESPTSDLAEETGSDSSTQSSRHSPAVPVESPTSVAAMEDNRPIEKFTPNNNSKQYTNTTASKEKHHYSVPYDPQLHVNSKPPYSFSCLIFMAIEDSHARALPVKEIYSWITDHFPYFIKAPTGWKNSVRHNLSLNKCFRKVDKAPNLGKGSLWIVDPQYRPNLLNALSKAPYHPCASLDRPAKPPILPPTSLSAQQQELIAIKTQSRLPNPELFPYLSKRLAASEADRINEAEESEEDSLDDVDAAAAMLELKHGQTGSNGSHDTFTREYVQQKYIRKKSKMRGDELIPLISTSPSEDHTYTVEYPSVNYKQSQPVSPDEAYDSNDDNSRQYTDDYEKSKSVEDDEESWSSDGAEQRNVASALLHLAGGSRKRGSESSLATASSAKRSHSQRAKRIHHRPTILQRPLKKHNRGRHLDDMSNNNNNNNNNNDNDKGYSGRPIFKPKIEQHYSNTSCQSYLNEATKNRG